MRFTIRDLIWLTVVVALGIGWWVDHRRLSVSYNAWNEQVTEAVKDTLRGMRLDPNRGQPISD
jgi:hypothetical protein